MIDGFSIKNSKQMFSPPQDGAGGEWALILVLLKWWTMELFCGTIFEASLTRFIDNKIGIIQLVLP